MRSIIVAIAATAVSVQATIPGFDISHYQGTVNFAAAKSGGAGFVIIKATEGTTYTDPTFSDHYIGATNAGLIRGGYHFAHPGETTGAAQATYFLAHGGGWSGDGITLPGMLDLESESDGECWGLSTSAMVAWIKDFSDTYHSKTTRYPMLYFNPSWWQTCTGNSNAFASTNPLVLAHYSSSIGTIPGSWATWTIWQYSDSSSWGGDADRFNGDAAGLTKLATG
ncbi:N,O-diacetylmuramidase [Thozetella sp. PMI_491]|nr:N,O-diacetylmuramidase [Thozetella sp. PMI_491]